MMPEQQSESQREEENTPDPIQVMLDIRESLDQLGARGG